jgi:hypothetical protein
VAEVTQDSKDAPLTEVVNEDFRSVDGVMTPFHKIAFKDNLQFMDMKMTKVTFLPTIDDKVFEKPLD